MATITFRLPVRLPARVGRRALRAGTAAIESAVPLARGERVLTVAHRRDGSPVIATKLAVYHQHPTGSGAWVRLGWEQVGRVDWEEPHGLVLTGWTPDVAARTLLAVARAGPLPALARERVAWTTLLATHIPVGGRDLARVTARRRPGDNRLLWMIALGPGVADSAAVRAELDATLARLRADLALGPER
jgi:hypothetical protein